MKSLTKEYNKISSEMQMKTVSQVRGRKLEVDGLVVKLKGIARSLFIRSTFY